MAEKKIERRYYEIQESRATESDDGKKTVAGYAAVFEKFSVDMGFFRTVKEKIQGGAFANSLRDNKDILALWNHNIDVPIGRKDKNLRLWEDSQGLKFELDTPDTTSGRDVFENIRAGIVKGMSFGFRVISDKWDIPKSKDEPVIRTLLEIDLIEISPVVFPAYPDTEVQARSIDELLKEKIAEIDLKSISEFQARQAKTELNLKFQKSVFGTCAK